MTAPTLGLETPEQKAARLAAEQKANTLTQPAVSLASQASQTAANASQAVQAPTDMMTKTISGKPPQDRIALAQKSWDTKVSQGAPAYEAALRSATQQAAGAGQLGSGMLRTTLGDLALQRQRDMDADYKTLMNDAITGSIADNQFDVATQTQQQGYQADQAALRFQQALDSQKLGLDTTLGLGDLGIKSQQAQTNAAGTMGNLELGRAELVAKYGAAEADRMIEAQKVANQASQFAQSQAQQASQFTAAQQAQIDQFNRNLELQRADLTAKYGAAEADRQIEAQKVANQQAQFTAAQGQQASQFATTAGLEQQKADLERLVQTGQLTIAQANQRLAELQNQQQYGLAQGNLTLEQQKVANQASQFTAAQQQQAGQFLATLSLDQSKFLLDKAVQEGQLSIAQANQLLADRTQREQNQVAQSQLTLEGQKVAQGQQAIDLDKLKLDLDRQVQLGQLSISDASQKLEAAKLAEQQRQFTASQAQQNTQFGLTLQEQQAARQQELTMQDQQFAQQASQAALDRSLQQSLQAAGFSQQSAQAALDRAHQDSMQVAALGAEAQQAALNRSLQASMQQAGFTQEQMQAALDRAQQTAMQTAGFGQETAQNALNRGLQLELQRLGLDHDTAQAVLDRAIKQQEVSNALSLGQTANQNQAAQIANQLTLGTEENRIQNRNVDLQSEIAKNQMYTTLASIIGLDKIQSAFGQSTTTNNTPPVERIVVGSHYDPNTGITTTYYNTPPYSVTSYGQRQTPPE